MYGAGIAFPADLYYNTIMNIQKTEQKTALPVEEEFAFSDKTVQGAKLGKKDNFLFVRSPRRYKLFTEGTDEVTFLEGAGHFKWARGETPFAAGETFLVQACGEYEINGACAFIVARRT